MSKLESLNPQRVFHYFEEISSVPRGSGNMKKIAEYCEKFALEHNLKYIRDLSDNVIIFKEATKGMEGVEPIILQGHLDMVCQKTAETSIDFEKEGIDLYIDGDYIKAKGTTLGADNGIALSMILAVLESDSIAHPPIEAVFTVDEEVGMLGAMALDMSLLLAKRMINIDSEDEGVVTVSCAGGSDFSAVYPVERVKKSGTEVTLKINGLRGGHSGIEINSGRVNGDVLMGRFLDCVGQCVEFDIISINGGDKANAIPNACEAHLCVNDSVGFSEKAKACFETVKSEITHREPDFSIEVSVGDAGEFEVFDESAKNKTINSLICVLNGVVEMSAEIDGLVETSLNLGILTTENDKICFGLSLRSNKKSAHKFLARRLKVFFETLGFKCDESGQYPPWEFNDHSYLQKLFGDVYEKRCGVRPTVEAIHAGLECGVFSSAIEGMDCISIGPEMRGVHTTEEKLNIPSVGRTFEILTEVLANMK